MTSSVPTTPQDVAALLAGSQPGLVDYDTLARTLPKPVPFGATYDRRASGKKGVSLFLARTYDLISDPTTDPVISWSQDGTSFLIHDSDALAESVLSRFFKHSNISSFIRQLNMYSFHKVGEPSHQEYYNPLFLRGHPTLLRHVKRKKSRKRANAAAARASADPHAAQPAALSPAVQTELRGLKRQRDGLIKDVAKLQASQESMEQQISTMALENEALRNQLALAEATQNEMNVTIQQIVALLASQTHQTATTLPNNAAPRPPRVVIPPRQQANPVPDPDTLNTPSSASFVNMLFGAAAAQVAARRDAAGDDGDDARRGRKRRRLLPNEEDHLTSVVPDLTHTQQQGPCPSLDDPAAIPSGVVLPKLSVSIPAHGASASAADMDLPSAVARAIGASVSFSPAPSPCAMDITSFLADMISSQPPLPHHPVHHTE